MGWASIRDRCFRGRRSDIPELLGQAGLVVFSTTPIEDFGIASIEAMAAGVPVIASDLRACREVLQYGAGGELLPAEAERQALEQRGALTLQYDIRHCAERRYKLLAT